MSVNLRSTGSLNIEKKTAAVRSRGAEADVTRERRLRIGYFIESCAVGGSERSTTLLIRGLDFSKYEAFVLCPKNSNLQAAVNDWMSAGATVIPDERIFAAGPHRLTDLLHLTQLIKRLKLDILHIQMLGGGCRLATIAAKLAGVRAVVLTQRGAASELTPVSRFISRTVVGMLDLATANSEDTKRLAKINYGWPDYKVRVVYNGIDTKRFSPRDKNASRECFGIANDAPVVVATGRLSEQKGFETALRAMPAILEIFPDAIFLLAGGAS